MNRRKSFLSLFCVLVILGSFSVASAEVGFNGIGGRVGFVDPDGGDGTITFGVVADLGTFAEQVPWDVSLMYWSTGEDVGAYEWSYSDMAIRSSVRYLFLVDEWRPYAGGGIGIHMLSAEVESQYGSAENSDSEFGFQIVAGVETDLSPRWKGDLGIQIDFGDVEQTAVLFSFIYAIGK